MESAVVSLSYFITDFDLDNYSINGWCLSYNISMYGGFYFCICIISVVHEFFVANTPLFSRTHWSVSILGLDLASKLSSVLVRCLTTHRTPLFILCCEMCLAYKWGACQAYKLGSVDIVKRLFTMDGLWLSCFHIQLTHKTSAEMLWATKFFFWIPKLIIVLIVLHLVF